jgi:hypothetical protein
MIRVDPFTFGYHCKASNLVSAKGSIEFLCDLFAKEVLPSITAVTGTNLPPAAPQPLHLRDHGRVRREDAVDILSVPMGQAAVSPIVIALLGEDDTSHRDLKRGEDVIRKFMAMRTSRTDNSLLFLERGLKTKHQRLLLSHPEIVADEWDIVAGYGSERNRSVITAAYCVTCLAGGDQSKKGRVLILFGQNHVADIVEAFKVLSGQNGPFKWISHRPRALHVMKNQLD